MIHLLTTMLVNKQVRSRRMFVNDTFDCDDGCSNKQAVRLRRSCGKVECDEGCDDGRTTSQVRSRRRSRTRSSTATRVARTSSSAVTMIAQASRFIRDHDRKRASSAALKVTRTSNSTATMIVSKCLDCKDTHEPASSMAMMVARPLKFRCDDDCKQVFWSRR